MSPVACVHPNQEVQYSIAAQHLLACKHLRILCLSLRTHHRYQHGAVQTHEESHGGVTSSRAGMPSQTTNHGSMEGTAIRVGTAGEQGGAHTGATDTSVCAWAWAHTAYAF